MTRRTLGFLALCLTLSLLCFALAQWVPQEKQKRADLFRQSGEAQAFLQLRSQEIDAARQSLSAWKQRWARPLETRLIEAVSRFQRPREDFRLVGLMQIPEGILLEAECRSQAAVEFLLFCDRELPDLAPTRIFLGCPSGTRIGSLRTEISFRPLPRLGVLSALHPSEGPPSFSVLNPRRPDLRIRQ